MDDTFGEDILARMVKEKYFLNCDIGAARVLIHMQALMSQQQWLDGKTIS
jgi:hypothetical protein